MRVLYFAPEYYASHGGRTHARNFFKELAADPRVSHAEVFPPCPAGRAEATGLRGSAGRTLARRARSEINRLYRRLPFRVASQMDLFRPSKTTYQALSAALSAGQIDAVVLRLSARFRYIERLRRDHPGCRLVIEYNATPFDERLQGIAGERRWRREEARQLAMADAVSAVSEYLRSYLVALEPALESKVFVNPNGADPSAYALLDPAVRADSRREMGAPDDAFVVGYVGGMETWRRLPELVGWIGRARLAGLDRVFLALIGTGRDLERVMALISSDATGLAGHAFCSQSWVPLEQVPRMTAAFDCGLLSFQHPHCCQQKAFEYLLAGLPVIGPSGSVPSPFVSGDYGTFEFGHDFDGFLRALRSVHDDLPRCRVAAARGRELVTDRFTWKANASRALDALELRGRAIVPASVP